MQPARYDFPVRRGDDEVLGVILEEQDPFTLEYRPYLKNGDTAFWLHQVGDGGVTSASTEDGGGLAYDPSSRMVTRTLTHDVTAALPVGVSVRFAIKRRDSAGRISTIPEGTYLVTGP